MERDHFEYTGAVWIQCFNILIVKLKLEEI
jgi:hypothetical protein